MIDGIGSVRSAIAVPKPPAARVRYARKLGGDRILANVLKHKSR